MTVIQLIARLKAMPPDLPVWFRVPDDYFDGEVVNVEREQVKIRIQQNVGSQYEEIEVVALT